MSNERTSAPRTAASCFETLLAFADERGDHLLAALITDAQVHFLCTYEREPE